MRPERINCHLGHILLWDVQPACAPKFIDAAGQRDGIANRAGHEPEHTADQSTRNPRRWEDDELVHALGPVRFRHRRDALRETRGRATSERDHNDLVIGSAQIVKSCELFVEPRVVGKFQFLVILACGELPPHAIHAQDEARRLFRVEAEVAETFALQDGFDAWGSLDGKCPLAPTLTVHPHLRSCNGVSSGMFQERPKRPPALTLKIGFFHRRLFGCGCGVILAGAQELPDLGPEGVDLPVGLGLQLLLGLRIAPDE
mmetsp:Transcript_117287/g.230061  ORF Transcript_117287/g.230061 Transcript_117287/m.230061 type:complete len:258 (+) Transcript_117287:731-1504(+)